MEIKIKSNWLVNGVPKMLDIYIQNLDLSNQREVEKTIKSIKDMANALSCLSVAKIDESHQNETSCSHLQE